MRRIMAAAVSSSLALAGCHKPAVKSEGGAATASASASAVAAAPGAGAPPGAAPAVAGPPARKPGLWSQTMASTGGHQTLKLCLDAATEKELQITGQQAAGDRCRKKAFARTAAGWSFESVCDLGQAGVVTSRGLATGDFDSHYKVEIESTTAGSSMPQANGARHMTLEAQWEGPCPAGMKPGDMRMANGMTLNVAAMRGRAAGK